MGCHQAKTLPTGPIDAQYQQKGTVGLDPTPIAKKRKVQDQPKQSVDNVDNVVINGIKCVAHYPEVDRQLPVLVFVHGGGVPDSSDYSRTIGDMVLAGFVVVATMQDSMNGGMTGGAKYTNRIITGLNSGVLRGSAKTDTIGLVGHALGGLTVASWAASNHASAHPEVKALVTLHGPMWHGSSKGISMPILVVSGSKDWMVQPGKMLKLYRDCSSQQKVYIEIRGAGHNAMCDAHVDVGEGRAAAVAFQSWLNHDSAAQHRLYEHLGEDMDLVAYLHTPDHQTVEVDVVNES